MANDKTFKIKNGLSATRYLQSSTALAASDVDMSLGSYLTKALSANTTFTFSNPPASGTAGSFALEVTGADVTVGYDLANAAYDSVSFSVNSQEANSTGITFNTTGTKMFICGESGLEVNEYALSTAFDVSTASFTTNFSVSAQETAPSDIVFKPDGTKMYISGGTGDDISQYSLSTAYDISTASFDNVTFSVASQSNAPYGLRFNNDGTKFFICDRNNNFLFQYSLSTAYDISTAGYDSVSYDPSSAGQGPTSISFNGDGTKLFMISAFTGLIHQFSLSTAFDLSSISYDSVTFAIENSGAEATGMTFSSDGLKMYTIDEGTDLVYQYSTSASATATITYPSSVKWSGATTPDAPAAGEKDVYVFVTTDGGTTYYGKQAGDAVA